MYRALHEFTAVKSTFTFAFIEKSWFYFLITSLHFAQECKLNKKRAGPRTAEVQLTPRHQGRQHVPSLTEHTSRDSPKARSPTARVTREQRRLSPTPRRLQLSSPGKNVT